MLLVRPPKRLPPNTALCLGAFDGMHRGHVALLQQAAKRAPKIAIATFDPHPALVLAPERAPSMLQSLGQTRRCCAQLGVDAFALLPFSRELANTPAERFVEELVIEGLGPRHVVVGQDFFYGAGRRGTPETLCAQLEAAGLGCSVVPLIDRFGQRCGHSEGRDQTPAQQNKISSTLLRQLVAEGRLEEARQGLGRHYALEGEVVHGQARGRDLGFRTANLDYAGLAPRPGVYSAFLRVVKGPDSDTENKELPAWPAVCNVGSNPTFAQTERAKPHVETHVLDQDLGESLYGATVEIAFVARLRDEQRFSGMAELKTAIARDVESARRTLTAGGTAVHDLDPRPIPRPAQTDAHG